MLIRKVISVAAWTSEAILRQVSNTEESICTQNTKDVEHTSHKHRQHVVQTAIWMTHQIEIWSQYEHVFGFHRAEVKATKTAMENSYWRQ